MVLPFVVLVEVQFNQIRDFHGLTIHWITFVFLDEGNDVSMIMII